MSEKVKASRAKRMEMWEERKQRAVALREEDADLSARLELLRAQVVEKDESSNVVTGAPAGPVAGVAAVGSSDEDDDRAALAAATAGTARAGVPDIESESSDNGDAALAPSENGGSSESDSGSADDSDDDEAVARKLQAKKLREEAAARRGAEEAAMERRKARATARASRAQQSQKSLDELKLFADLPLTGRTMMGLEKGNYKYLTNIQGLALPHALTGRDLLGAAKTGSGKTLSFLVPILERMHFAKWDAESGLGALVLSPTRELALQIFRVLQVIGFKHPFAAALLTGGRNVDEEKKRLHSMNIIVGTPGRVLHHLDETSSLVVDNLAVLVMDEADRLLDMGFRPHIDGILQHLPTGSRQTLLFSATQTADVRALGQLCLRDPKYVAVHALTVDPTPQRLCQNFMVIELHRKLDALMSFLRRHPNDKTVVFVSTCNQVKFMYLAMSKLLRKARVPTMCLTGKMKQFRRDEVFLTFCRCKSAVLFCTDIAARGLDFPMVHWVVQYDCPDSVQTYIHRAGRTARAGARGVNLLMLTPSEAPILSYLHTKQIPLREISIKPHLMPETRDLFVALVVQDMKYQAQKAFIAYLRSLLFASNKTVFKIGEINVEKFAQSLGLLKVPDLSELATGRAAKNLPWDIVNYMQKQRRAAAAGPVKAARAPVSDGDDDDDLATQMNDAAAAAAATGSGPDALSVDSGDDDATNKGLTRRERHLKASDMFRTLQQKQRYAAKDGVFADGGGDNSDDDLFVKQARPAPGAADKAMALTAEERMAGLSKHKKRDILKNADLRIKDLNLATRTKFSDDDDDGPVQSSDEDVPVGRCGLVTNAAAAEDSDSSGDERDHAAVLRQRVAKSDATDREKVRSVKKARADKKKGVTAERGGEDADSVALTSGGEYDSEASESSAGSADSDMVDLLKAARGELYSESDGSDGDSSSTASSDEDAPLGGSGSEYDDDSMDEGVTKLSAVDKAALLAGGDYSSDSLKKNSGSAKGRRGEKLERGLGAPAARRKAGRSPTPQTAKKSSSGGAAAKKKKVKA